MTLSQSKDYTCCSSRDIRLQFWRNLIGSQNLSVQPQNKTTMPLASDPVPSIESMYRRKDGRVLIEIKLTSVNQLFNSFDPAPFYEKELDDDAEDYIVDTVQDFP